MKSLILEPKSSLVELLKNFLRTIVLFIVEIKVQKLFLLKYTQDNGTWGGNFGGVGGQIVSKKIRFKNIHFLFFG